MKRHDPLALLVKITAITAGVLLVAVFLAYTLKISAARTEPTVSRTTTTTATTTALTEAVTTVAPTETPTTEPIETTRARDHSTIIPDGPSFAELSPDGRIDNTISGYASLVPEGAAKDDAYFADALFIGNSIQQIQRQIGSIPADYITTGDYNVHRYFEWELPMPDGTRAITADYVARKAYGKVYLTFGINEVSYDNQEDVWVGFRKLLDDVQLKQPNATIYLVGLLPVYPPSMNEVARRLITPEKIIEFNHKLAILAEDEGAYMLNPAEALQDENGLLNAEWSQDGVHFGSTATALWDEYTRRHTID